MKLEIGDRFYHAKDWCYRLDMNQRCVVVQVTHDRVYWRVDTGRSYASGTSKKSFPISDMALHVLRKIPFGL